MTILAIGQSSFLATAVQKHLEKQDSLQNWRFVSHEDALRSSVWSDDIKTVIGFACDPCVKEGVFSDFDHKLAQKAQEIGAQYIMLSSRTVYGMPEKPLTVFTEGDNLNLSLNLYGAAKRQIEDDLLNHFDNVTILRLSNIFGHEYNAAKPRFTFFGMMLKSLKEEGEIRFFMGPETEKDFLPAPIFAEYIAEVASRPETGVYNLGAGISTSAESLANFVVEGYGDGNILPNELDVIDSFVLNMDKTRGTFGLSDISPQQIQNFCIEIGKRLKKAES